MNEGPKFRVQEVFMFLLYMTSLFPFCILNLPFVIWSWMGRILQSKCYLGVQIMDSNCLTTFYLDQASLEMLCPWSQCGGELEFSEEYLKELIKFNWQKRRWRGDGTVVFRCHMVEGVDFFSVTQEGRTRTNEWIWNPFKLQGNKSQVRY